MAIAVLTWNANTESDLAGYKVYRGFNSAAPTLLATVGKVTTYSDSSLPNGSDYTVEYAITAFDSAGNESAKSSVVSKAVNTVPPQAPTGLAVAIQ